MGVMDKILIVVVHDGVCNSVFAGQVLDPLCKKLDSGLFSRIHVVSFERQAVSEQVLYKIAHIHPQLSITIIRRLFFINTWSLWFQIKYLKRLCAQYEQYELLARGAISGFIALKALNKTRCKHLTIQARGLLAEEYRHEHQHSRGIAALFHRWRAYLYESVERIAYASKKTFPFYTIEAVSSALEEYLVHQFGTHPAHCTLAQGDIPQHIMPARIQEWRARIRHDLDIPDGATVYCFSGAAKLWQCPSLVINFFTDLYRTNKNSFLLVLTPDVEEFKAFMKTLPAQAYCVKSVSHDQIYCYLAAADVGLAFREPGIVSWVSRPVKAMEYEAVGLPIIHNNTVDWLIQRYGANRSHAVE
jgi:hypothetical protein